MSLIIWNIIACIYIYNIMCVSFPRFSPVVFPISFCSENLVWVSPSTLGGQDEGMTCALLIQGQWRRSDVFRPWYPSEHVKHMRHVRHVKHVKHCYIHIHIYIYIFISVVFCLIIIIVIIIAFSIKLYMINYYIYGSSCGGSTNQDFADEQEVSTSNKDSRTSVVEPSIHGE